MQDTAILRELAAQYAQVATSEACRARPERYRQLNSLQRVRPPVLVFEVPWGELTGEEALQCRCEDAENRQIEQDLRRKLYQFRHFEGDFTVHPHYRVDVRLHSTGIGLMTQEETRDSGTGSDIQSHHYDDQLPDLAAVERLQLPQITYDRAATEAAVARCEAVFRGLLPVKKAGVQLYFASWDVIPRLHGTENCLYDLYDNPELAHALIERFTQIHLHELDQYEALNVLDTDVYYLHCTPAVTYDLPVKDMDAETITAKDVWCRAMAQIFGVVSPEMLDEFDLPYTQRLFDRCGLAYYGCCEPLHNKIDLLSRRFPNLRRISITPWADVDVAADRIAGRYVLSYKSNPAYVAGTSFDPEPVRQETRRVLAACQRSGTPCEFILKDISTVRQDASRLTQWVDTVNGVIDEVFG